MKIFLILLFGFVAIFANNFTGKFIYGANKNYKVYIHDFGANNLTKSCGGEDIDEITDLDSFVLYVGDKKYIGSKQGSQITFSPIAIASYNDKNITLKMLVKSVVLPILRDENISVLSHYDSDTCFIKSKFDSQNDTLILQPNSNYSSLSYIKYIDENLTTYQNLISNYNGVHPIFTTVNKVVNHDGTPHDLSQIYDLNSTELLANLKSKILNNFKQDNPATGDDEAKSMFFDFDTISFTENFAFEAEGITFYYPGCEILPCINGGISVFFSFSELSRYKKQ
ncbi:hypothetical protein CIG1485E_0760 [Campylobacter iguaniorum]|uniref:DUF3298 domain-containing protein n=1 Tax=Campylobacter iguaniorum TaxID=1244531 RepID=A0A076F8P2_9BACT|nr:RsiV family protein [Campylobacter iguaniorum]AII14605.1 hypothetical protein CIG1485E_0760 [Campylobacter iguaniorum]